MHCLAQPHHFKSTSYRFGRYLIFGGKVARQRVPRCVRVSVLRDKYGHDILLREHRHRSSALRPARSHRANWSTEHSFQIHSFHFKKKTQTFQKKNFPLHDPWRPPWIEPCTYVALGAAAPRGGRWARGRVRGAAAPARGGRPRGHALDGRLRAHSAGRAGPRRHLARGG